MDGRRLLLVTAIRSTVSLRIFSMDSPMATQTIALSSLLRQLEILVNQIDIQWKQLWHPTARQLFRIRQHRPIAIDLSWRIFSRLILQTTFRP